MNIKWVLTVAAAMLLFISGFAKSEPDEVLWNYNMSAIYSSYPAVHPNGNVLIRKGVDLFELNGLTGEYIRHLFIPNEGDSGDRIEISQDGSKVLVAGCLIDYASWEILRTDFQKTSIKFYHPHNNKIIYVKNGYDLAIIDLEQVEISTHHFPHTITDHEVSLDGRFLAIACKDFIAEPGNQNTFLYFYNAQTMKSIRDLENTPSTGRVIEFLQFSETSKYVGYGHPSGGERKATFFSCDPPYTKKEFGVQGIGFIKDEYVFLTSADPSFSVIWDINQEKEIYKTLDYGSFYPLYNKIFNSIMVGGKGLTALDFNKILSGVSVNEHKEPQPNFTTEYRKGVLTISNYTSTTGIVNVQILDLQGKVVFTTDHSRVSGMEMIGISVVLSDGVYILQLQDGKQNYSQKFIVTR